MAAAATAAILAVADAPRKRSEAEFFALVRF
jgi:hypothetical protein